MRHHREVLVGRPIDTPTGSVKIVSRVDSFRLGRVVAMRHRPVAVEVTRNGQTTHRRIGDPGFLTAVLPYARLVLAIFRRRR